MQKYNNSMLDRTNLVEETFGILTDDGLALEATLVRSANLFDRDVRVVQAWVPKYPLTRSSVLQAARYDSLASGLASSTANIAFDLRGSGESDGVPSREGFDIDLRSVHAWAQERFGPNVVFRQMGFPELGGANRLITLPLRPGVVAELYRYNPPGRNKANIIFFSRYTHFSHRDDALCRAIADDGFTVYGSDLMRYLLLAAPLTVEALYKDANTLAAQTQQPLFFIGRAFSAGPTLLMATGTPAINGVIVTGPAQEGLTLPHIFSQENPARFLLSRYIKALEPRPSVFLWNQSESGQLSPEGLQTLHSMLESPSLWGMIPKINAKVLLNALVWLINNS